jgi:hypothetical protein
MEPTIAPHMIPRYLLQPSVLIQLGIDAVEIFNAGAITPGCNWLAYRSFGKIGLPHVSRSDAHLPERIGTAVTRFEGNTAEALRISMGLGLTAAEGKSWQITTYLKLLPVEVRKMRSAFSAANPRLARLIPRSSPLR